jgi:hypothetical protein
MRKTADPAALPTGASHPLLAGKVLAHALVSLSPPEIPSRRKLTSLSAVRKSGNQTTLRYSDEQTVAAAHAVLATMNSLGDSPESFVDWGVIAATRYLGRSGLADAVQIFSREGVWGVSPHLIPHFALHSASGTISLTLGIHGPNLGVGGGLHAAVEGFLTALTWLASGTVPGVWLVMTGWAPELVPVDVETPASSGNCHALAIAIVGPTASSQSENSYTGVTVRGLSANDLPPPDAPLNLSKLAEILDRPHDLNSPLLIATDPAGTYGVELTHRIVRTG